MQYVVKCVNVKTSISSASTPVSQKLTTTSLFTRIHRDNKMTPKELNYILLHTVPNGWAKQAYIQGREFEIKSYKAT